MSQPIKITIERNLFLARLCQPLCLQSVDDPELDSIKQVLTVYPKTLTEDDLQQLAAACPDFADAIQWVVRLLKDIQRQNIVVEPTPSFFSRERAEDRQQWHETARIKSA